MAAKKKTTTKSTQSTMSDLEKRLKRKIYSIYNSEPNGREKGFMESIYWGVGNRPYIDIQDVQKAGIKPNAKRISPSKTWYYATQDEAYKTLLYRLKKDGIWHSHR